MSERRDDKPGTTAPESDVLTPRGGFMARPGLKQPPRHAVVIRLGDIPTEPEIPVARSSVPPPPPDSEPAIPNSQKATQHDLSAPKSAGRVVALSAPMSAVTTPVAESAPPPSDSPLVSSIPAPAPSRAPEALRKRDRSRWTIFAAAAAGTVLGLLSVATTRRPTAHNNPPGASISEPRVAAAARPVVAPPKANAQSVQQSPATPAAPGARDTPSPAQSQAPIAPRAPVVWPPPPKDKRPIF